MWQNKFVGVMGIWIILLAFLGFSESLHRILLVITGILITITAFRSNFLIKPTEELEKSIKDDENKDEDKQEESSSN